LTNKHKSNIIILVEEETRFNVGCFNGSFLAEEMKPMLLMGNVSSFGRRHDAMRGGMAEIFTLTGQKKGDSIMDEKQAEQSMQLILHSGDGRSTIIEGIRQMTKDGDVEKAREAIKKGSEESARRITCRRR
jgi:hypothetical protein